MRRWSAIVIAALLCGCGDELTDRRKSVPPGLPVKAEKPSGLRMTPPERPLIETEMRPEAGVCRFWLSRSIWNFPVSRNAKPAVALTGGSVALVRRSGYYYFELPLADDFDRQFIQAEQNAVKQREAILRAIRENPKRFAADPVFGKRIEKALAEQEAARCQMERCTEELEIIRRRQDAGVWKQYGITEGQPLSARRAALGRRIKDDSQVPGCVLEYRNKILEIDAASGRFRNAAGILRTVAEREIPLRSVAERYFPDAGSLTLKKAVERDRLRLLAKYGKRLFLEAERLRKTVRGAQMVLIVRGEERKQFPLDRVEFADYAPRNKVFPRIPHGGAGAEPQHD